MAANRFLLIALSLLLFAPSYAQIHFQRKTINLENNVIDYKLATSPIIHHSESVWADSVMLISGIDYQLDYRKAMLRVVGTPQTSNLTIEFLLVPEFLNKPLQTWETQIHSDSLFSTIKRRANPVFISDTKLDIQGVKSFAITFSDDEAFDLKQSLYVNLSGELAKGVSIDAQLSDSQSKLSPEGDSKELSSLDKVFIRVYSKRFELAMGDLEVKFSGTRYTEYFSKFEGLNAWYNNKHYLQAAYSAGSGKYTSIPVVVIDGKQGPYYLKANDYQPGFIIVAGSEEIYVDNSLLERGVDYSIDYAEGSIMFKRLISSTNSVLARFQYSDEYYPQNSYINSSNWKLNDKLSISHHFIWQQDDRDNPLLYEFSAADRDSLRLAGDNAVWGEGVFEVQNGDYKLVEGTTHYEYAPDDSLAIYNLIFSYVGLGQGDYEEYAVGKYRYIGEQQGSWLPQKRLIAPVKRGNLDFALNYGASNLKAGLETIGSVNDRNTFSDVGDEDNFGGIAYGFGELRFAQASLKLEHEQRTANSYLFGKYRDPASEYDFNALASADSLAQQESNVTLGYTAKNLSISALLRYKDIYDLYSQRAVRLTSTSQAWGIIPAINLRSTVSRQDAHDPSVQNSMLQYHQGELSWSWRSLKLRFETLYNLLDSDTFGTSYLKLSPTFSFGNSKKSFTQLAFADDISRLKAIAWKTSNKSQTYALKHLSSYTNQRVELNISHREIQQPLSDTNPKSNYDIINIRANNSFLKQSLSLFSNYQLNQTEFYPKIRELQYIGNGLGLYDSTGVSISTGDFDYVYITSPTGTLSSELNAMFTLYLKPGNLSNSDFLKRWQSDTTLNLIEQSSVRDDWKSYFFYPGTVYNETSTIFGKQYLQQNLWLDIMRNHITGNLQLSLDRSLDRRYQSPDRAYTLSRAAQMDIKGFNTYSTRLQYNRENSNDSRYQSQIELQSFTSLVQRNLATLTNIQAEFSYSSESGGKQDGSEGYKLSSYRLSPSIRSVWMQKYRLSASVNVMRNYLSGSSYFSFLPQKRAGWITGATLGAIYRLNNFSSFTLDYRYTDYPRERGKQELRLEFKAEL